MISAITSMLPIVLITVIIIGVVMVNKQFSKKPLTFQKSKWIFIGYVCILFISAGFSTLLPNSEAKVIENMNIDDYGPNNSYEKAMRGEFSEIDQDDINESWEFSYTGDSLSLDSIISDALFLIEETDDLTDKLEVHFIQGWHVVEANSITIDVREYSHGMDFELNSDILRLIGPKIEQAVHLAFAEPEFTIQQFEDVFETGFGSSELSFFYIRVPSSLEVNYPEYLPVHFVES